MTRGMAARPSPLNTKAAQYLRQRRFSTRTQENELGVAQRLRLGLAMSQILVEKTHEVGGRRSATRQSVVTVERAPAARNARLKLCTPSPRTIFPASVSQAESVTRSTPDNLERGSFRPEKIFRAGAAAFRREENARAVGIHRIRHGVGADVQERYSLSTAPGEQRLQIAGRSVDLGAAAEW